MQYVQLLPCFNNFIESYFISPSHSIADRRIYPAFDILKSGTRKDDLLLGQERLTKVWMLRNVISQMDDIEALNFLYSKIKDTKNNDEFLLAMNDL